MEMIDEYKLVHMRGTPACGKSTLAMQLCTAFKAQNRLAVYIPLYDGAVESYLTAFTRYASSSGHSAFNPSMLDNYQIVWILDEAQSTYQDYGLWYGFIKSRNRRSTASIVLFSSYGSPSGGITDWKIGSPLAQIRPYQRVA